MQKVTNFVIGGVFQDLNSESSIKLCSSLTEEEQAKVGMIIKQAKKSTKINDKLDIFLDDNTRVLLQDIDYSVLYQDDVDLVELNSVLDSLVVGMFNTLVENLKILDEDTSVIFGYGNDNHLLMEVDNTLYSFSSRVENVVQDALDVNSRLCRGYPDILQMQEAGRKLVFDIYGLSLLNIEPSKNCVKMKK